MKALPTRATTPGKSRHHTVGAIAKLLTARDQDADGASKLT